MLAYLIHPTGFDWADGGILIAALLAFVWFFPHTACTVPLWLLTHSLWSLHRWGRENVPARGGAVLISNHVSYVDWLIIWAACRRRVRFVIWSVYFKNPLLYLLLKWVRAIPIDGSAGPGGVRRSLRAAEQALANGDLILIFPEGRLSRNGLMLPFHRGLEPIARRAQVPIVPVYLAGLWGSIFSYAEGKILFKWPKRWFAPVMAAFGRPLPSTATAPEVRTAIQELAAECDRHRDAQRRPAHVTFLRRAARHPFRPCFIDTTNPGAVRHLSYGKSAAGALCLMNWLRPRLTADQFVGLWLPSSVGGALANIAVSFLGKTTVNLNYTAGPDAVRSAAKQCGLRHVLTARRFLERLPLDLGPDVQLILLEDVRAQITGAQKLAAFLKVLLLPGWLLGRWLGLHRHRLDDLATVVFSSGSTGEPKGIMLSQRNIAANVASMIGAIDLRKGDRLLGILPFFHSFGYTVTIWAPIVSGAAAIYSPDPRAAKEIGELCRAQRATILLATATFLRFFLRRCGPDDFHSLRLLVCGAEKLPTSLAREFEAKFGLLPLEGYGCTELSPVVAVNVPDRTINDVTQVGTKVGTIGQAIPGVAVRIVQLETDEVLPPDTEGRLLVTGANVMVGYLHQPALTATKVRHGWYDTGDVGRKDADGFITLTGRLARFAKMAGEMVPLERVEEELHAALGTADRVLAVTAVPDPKRGERVVVLFTQALKGHGLGIRELCAKVVERGLPNLWAPGERDFYEVPELPILGSGKLDLRRVTELAREVVARERGA